MSDFGENRVAFTTATPGFVSSQTGSLVGVGTGPVRKDRPAPIRRRHIVKKHQPKLTDGIKWPVTVRRIGDPK